MIYLESILVALLGGIFPIFNGHFLKEYPVLIIFLFSSFFAMIFFTFFLKKEKDKEIEKKYYKYSGIAGILSMAYFLLIFYGIKFTTPTNVVFISLLEMFFSLILFNLILKEKLSKNKLFGTITISMAVLILILNSKLEYGMGNFLIVIASIIAPFLNFFQKKAIQKIEIYNVLFLRYFLSFFLMLFFILFTEKNIDIVKYLFDIKFILSAMLNGLIFFALSKILWLNSIKKICITYGVAILNTTPLFSILFLLFFGIFPDFFQILASILLILGLFVFIKNEKECKL